MFFFCSLVFLLLFLITGIFYQRITDIVAFFLSAVLLTIYVIAHYFTPRNEPNNADNSQATIRLVNKRIFRKKKIFFFLFIFIFKIRLIFTIIFNVCFIPFAFTVIKDYDRDEFSKRYVLFFFVLRTYFMKFLIDFLVHFLRHVFH